ncbi:aminotransferase class IV [Nitratireductor sp. ZSWI3]|uniref:aminotransferase class IV n=1 Tax=Nitratireductor sp. ZSWI3 TaxID=2966359 RepID=UPI00214FD47C|nr:aminotransferase class IV [Nitratireductor sp. ZSWI3]MCR4267563.1 aminotransferase class IV [Nitratireductor sp. ZSWI3]
MIPASSAQSFDGDPRNDNALVYVNGAFVHRDKATVSVFDAGFVLGDGVWEGLRLVNGKLLSVDQHMDRLFEGARAISMDIGMTRAEVVQAVMDTCATNGFTDNTHIRLMITRGRKTTPNQDPRFMASGATVVIVAELKKPRAEFAEKGLSLFTSTFRCSTPDVFDLRWNSHSRLNLIQALIQAIAAGADEALMLDQRGMVASCNSTNFFIVRKGELWTSPGLYSFNGITRGHVFDLWNERIGVGHMKDFTLTQAYSADEAFVTGTLGGITPVSRIDGRAIGDGKPGAMTMRIAKIYWDWVRDICI